MRRVSVWHSKREVADPFIIVYAKPRMLDNVRVYTFVTASEKQGPGGVWTHGWSTVNPVSWGLGERLAWKDIPESIKEKIVREG